LDVKNISEGGDILSATGEALKSNSTSAQYFTLQIKIKKLDEKKSKHDGFGSASKMVLAQNFCTLCLGW
jgi:hypothetical protein